MKLVFIPSAFITAASLGATDAFRSSIHQTLLVVSPRSLHKPCSYERSTSNLNGKPALSHRNRRNKNLALCMKDNKHTDETIPDSSRRFAMLQLTAMVSSAFLVPNKAVADDEFELFSEESDEIDEFLYDEEEEDYVIGDEPSSSRIYSSQRLDEVPVDAWDKFTPRLTPTDGSALSQAFTSSQTKRPQKTVRKQQATTSTLIEPELSTDHMDAGSLFALSFPVMVLGGAAVTFEKEKNIIANANDPQHTATGTPKVKLVMVADEPYGLDRGRRYYNGVNVVREYCDASAPRASNECVDGIAGYLQNVSHGGSASDENEETASAIISYLDSLSSGSRVNNNHAPQATGVAFSSYLQGLSEGNFPAPSSAESVAVYLDSLASKERERVSRLEARVDELESSMDDKVARELNKIATILVEQSGFRREEYDDFRSTEGGYQVNGLNGQVNGSGYTIGSGEKQIPL